MAISRNLLRETSALELRHGYLAQLVALDLEADGRGRLGKVVDREHAHRHLVVREAVLAVRDHGGLVERGTRLQHDEGHRAHAVAARHGDGLAGLDAWHFLDALLDLQWIDQEAGEPQNVAHAAEEREAANAVDLREIAGANVAVG